MGHARVEHRRRREHDERPAAWPAYGKLLRLFRDRAGLTQPQFGEAIGYSPELVASVEQGWRRLPRARSALTQRIHVNKVNGVVAFGHVRSAPPTRTLDSRRT